MIKSTLIIFLCLLATVILSCDKEADPKKAGSVEITAVNATGVAQPGIAISLFTQPSTEADGTNPSKALETVVTDANGVAKFDMKGKSDLSAGETGYFTVLRKNFNKSYEVLGTVDLVIQSGETQQAELVVSGGTYRYDQGYMPTTISSSLVVDEYNRWKQIMVVPCGDGLRVVADPSNETKVEAIGFGMLLSAYAKDQDTFDGLHRFYNSKRTATANNMMAWDVTCDGINDAGSATDGDVDVAFALIVADKQWGGTYLESAKAILEIISEHVIHECSVNGDQVLVLGPGYSNIAWGGCNEMDIMYHTPAFFRVFAAVTGDDMWNQLADDSYITLLAGTNASTGLVPDWQTASGTPGPGTRAGHYGYDACRAPWRITLDYLWNGNTTAEQWSKKIATWAKGVGPANIVDGYELDGTPIGDNGLNSAFLGGFSVATMAHSQATADAFGVELSKLRDTYWFNINTRCLYLFTLSGNFWNPLEE